ncbi:MAG: class I tRNA ligase family protein [Anaerolineae bacterium]
MWEVEEDGTTPQHIEGVHRFLGWVWTLCLETAVKNAAVQPARQEAGLKADRELERATHRTIKTVTEGIEALRFNTAISALMSLLGEIEAHRRMHGATAGVRSSYLTLLRLLVPLAPYITEELWARTGKRAEAGSIHHAAWPRWDPALTREDEVEIAVQVNGKIRARITVDAQAEEAELRERALAAPDIQDIIEASAVERVIVVPGRLVNIVTG